MKKCSLVLSFLPLLACSHPEEAPDKTLGGAVLGAAWGAGAGAIVGNQISYQGEGAAVGAGLGLVAGMATGLGYDTQEENLADYDRKIDELRVQNALNARSLNEVQKALDYPPTQIIPGPLTLFFDPEATSLRSGSLTELQEWANSLRQLSIPIRILVRAHSDDAGTPDDNVRTSEARARSVVAALGARGVPLDQITIEAKGSTSPVASNATPEGRQLNRRVEVIIQK